MVDKKFLVLFLVIFLGLVSLNSVNAAAENVTACGILNVSGTTYTLNKSIDSAPDGDCLIIANESIILDCAGYNITFGNATGGNGIINMEPVGTGFTNVTIKNCIILDNTTAFNTTAILFGENSSVATIFNNTITTDQEQVGGMFFDINLTNSNITSNTLTISGNNSTGISLMAGSDTVIDLNNITILGNLSSAIIFMDGTTSSNITSNNINISVSDPDATTAILLIEASNSNLLYNNTITTSGGGINIEDSTGTNMSSNTVISSVFNASAVYLIGANSSILEYNNITTSNNLSIAIVLTELINTLINLNNITTSNADATGIVIDDEATDSNITSNTIITSGDEAKGIYLGMEANNMRINSNTINTSGEDASGIIVGDNSTNVTIFDNTIVTYGNFSSSENSTFGGIFLDGGTFVINLSSNNITTSGIGAEGIWIWDSSNHTVDSNTITTTGEQGDGIYLINIQGTNLTSNTISISGVSAKGIHSQMSESSSLLFYSNVITTTANYSYGVYLQGDDYNNISSNNITTSGNASYGIYFNESHSTILSGNIIKTGEADSYVLYLLTASNHSVYNNIFNTSTSGSGVSFTSCDLNYFNTTNTTSTNIVGKTHIGGNFWTNTNGDGYSDYCANIDGDYYCDSAYTIVTVLPHTDYLPLTNYQSTTSACGTLNTKKRYVLNTSLPSNGTCFNITTNGVFLDFAGYNITGNTTGYGINITGYNDTTIFGGSDKGVISNFSNGLYISSSSNNSFEYFKINNSVQDAILLEGVTSANNNFTGIIVDNTNASHYDINFSTAGINGTWIIDIAGFANYTFTGAGGLVNFKEPDYGKIKFLEAINGSGTNLSSDVNIGSNSVFVNSSKSGLNKSANITLYNISYTVSSRRQEYSLDNSTWLECNSNSDPVCNNLSYDSDTDIFVFNVSHFTYFRATVDETNPTVTLSESSSTTTSLTITVSKTDTLSGISSCTSNRGTLSGSTLTESGLSCGTSYSYTITCTDYAGNDGSDTESFSTDACDSGGTTTTKTWTHTYAPSDEQFEEGYTKALSIKNRVKVKIGSTYHYVGVVSLTQTKATINITSDPVQVTLGVGEDAKVDVTDDGFYDIYVILNSIADNKADVTIKSIYEEVPEGQGKVTTTGEITDGEIEEEEEERNLTWLWILIGVVVLAVIIGGGIAAKKKQ